MPVYRLPDSPIIFPDPHEAEPDGLLAVGGDLSPQRLLLAYSNGIFPWFSFRDTDEPYWYCPMTRFVIFPNEIHISHSMRSLINRGDYRTTFNKDFAGVIAGCAHADGRYEMAGAWLDERIAKAYTQLHDMQYAASVEVWDKTGKLVGGLYGVLIGSCFMGESMFSLAPSASKFALIRLAQFMQQHGGKMIDCQLPTPHLASMGAREIPYDQYMQILNSDIG